MATPQITTSTRTDYQVQAEPSQSSHLAVARTLSVRRPQRNPFDPMRLTYTRSWFGSAAAGALLGVLGLRRFGWPLAAGLGALGAASLTYMRRFEPTHPTLERVTLRLPTLPPALDGLRIGQISDTHLGLPFAADNLRWAVEQMNREQPDLIGLTGDLAGLADGIPDIPPLLSGLRAPLGVYAVPGNHDYWEGLADVQAALMLADIPLLMNEHRHLRWNGADLWLAGIDDIWDGSPNLAAALDGVPRGAFTVLLAHSPDIADNATDYGFALQLSGHTHGGHLRLPLIGPFARPRYGLRYVMGLYQVGAMALYISRGLGGLPLRLMCRPEATILTLRRG
jgi:predicted MPP superfamily phosphohydrolase